MTAHKQQIGIQDTFSIIKKSSNPVSPLLEGLVNSLDSITKRRNSDDNFSPLIVVNLAYSSQNDLYGERGRIFSSLTLEDNGEGFTDDNLERFKSLADRGKGLNNRGTGKIQFFHRFKKICINSDFKSDSKYICRKIDYDINDNITYETLENNSGDFKTTITMSGFSGNDKEQELFLSFLDDLMPLKVEVFKRLLLRLFLEKQVGLNLYIRTFLDDTQKEEICINGNDIPDPDITDETQIPTLQLASYGQSKTSDIEWKIVNNDNVLTINRFKLPATEIDRNGIFLCSKAIAVTSFRPASLNEFLKKDVAPAGYRFITSISGKLLDDESNVNHTFDDFTFPRQKDIERRIKDGEGLFLPAQEFVFWEEVKNKLNEKLPQLYSDVISIKTEKEKKTHELAEKFGIPQEIARQTTVNLNDSEEKITKKLFEKQAEHLAKESIEIQRTYDELMDLSAKNLDPSDENYEQQIYETSRKLLDKIPQQNKEELARYVIRREMIVNTLRLALANELSKQKAWAQQKLDGKDVREEQEAIFHDLIFKRKAHGMINDLWILNEEFVHFYGCSDTPLKDLEINGVKLLKSDTDIEQALNSVGLKKNSRLQKRPDIFLFPEEGKCILIEFKAPLVELSDHLDQIPKYAKLIANYAQIKITQFYGYLIGETIDRAELSGRYKRAVYGNYWFYPSEDIKSIDEEERTIANIYQEIIPLSTMADRAEMRNRSFATKLGINQIASAIS